MAAALVCLVLLLALTGQSSALYCICKSGVSATVLQTNIDYACGAGADCSAIKANGACYNPDTLKDHCNYAVNSYFQNKGEASGTCDFKGSATTSTTIPINPPSGCVYPSSATSSGSPTPPSTSTPTPPSSSSTSPPPPPSSTGSSFSPPLFNTNITDLAPGGYFPNGAVVYRGFGLVVLVSLPLYLL